MMVTCDHCGRKIEVESALVFESDDEEFLSFCSHECFTARIDPELAVPADDESIVLPEHRPA